MSTIITINVKNRSLVNQNFFFFQQPAVYTGGPQVYTNSLFTQILQPYDTSGAVLTFTIVLQYYAGVQQQVAPPQVGKPSGYISASQPIGLTPAAGGDPVNNTTAMSVAPSLGLSVPINTTGPQAGSFRIISPVYDSTLNNYNAGSAVQTLTGGIILSNFVTAQPNQNLDCQPILKFYVQTGTFTPGTVMNFTASSATAALCDATPGFRTFDVSYTKNGTWDIKPFATFVSEDQTPALPRITPVPPNAEVLNEAGTAVISTGHAANFNTPVTLTNLSNPGNIQVFSEYQVGPTGGPYVGRMCTALLGSTATFS